MLDISEKYENIMLNAPYLIVIKLKMGFLFSLLFQIARYNYPKENSAEQHLYPIGCEKYYLWFYIYSYMYLVYTDGIRQRWFLLLYMSLNACPQQIKCVSSLREMNFYNLFSKS